MIIFPFGVDQSGNAARVTRIRVGLSGDIRTVNADTISSMLQAVERPSFRDNAVRLSKLIRIHSNCEDALAAIERACVDRAGGLP
jgi:UDP:flavonoid glycosyltransferase YjiC (YdhE family)